MVQWLRVCRRTTTTTTTKITKQECSRMICGWDRQEKLDLRIRPNKKNITSRYLQQLCRMTIRSHLMNRDDHVFMRRGEQFGKLQQHNFSTQLNCCEVQEHCVSHYALSFTSQQHVFCCETWSPPFWNWSISRWISSFKLYCQSDSKSWLRDSKPSRRGAKGKIVIVAQLSPQASAVQAPTASLNAVGWSFRIQFHNKIDHKVPCYSQWKSGEKTIIIPYSLFLKTHFPDKINWRPYSLFLFRTSWRDTFIRFIIG